MKEQHVWIVLSRDGALLSSGRAKTEQHAYEAGVEWFRNCGRKLGTIITKKASDGVARQTVDVKRDSMGCVVRRVAARQLQLIPVVR